MTRNRPRAKKAAAIVKPPKAEVSVRCFAMSFELTDEDGTTHAAGMTVHGENLSPESAAALIAIGQAAYRRLRG